MALHNFRQESRAWHINETLLNWYVEGENLVDKYTVAAKNIRILSDNNIMAILPTKGEIRTGQGLLKSRLNKQRCC